jgi:hypothetical protein
MRRLSPRIFIIAVLVLTMISVSAEAGTPFFPQHKNPEKSLFGKKRKLKGKSKKPREPKSVTKAKRAQEKKQDKLKAEYFDYVDQSKKRAFQIQSPAVQERIKNNQKGIKDRETVKKKKRSNDTKRGASKYK